MLKSTPAVATDEFTDTVLERKSTIQKRIDWLLSLDVGKMSAEDQLEWRQCAAWTATAMDLYNALLHLPRCTNIKYWQYATYEEIVAALASGERKVVPNGLCSY